MGRDGTSSGKNGSVNEDEEERKKKQFAFQRSAVVQTDKSAQRGAYGPSGEATSVAGQAGGVRMGERVAYGRPAILAAKEKAKGTKGKRMLRSASVRLMTPY